MAVKAVSSVDEAIEHINSHSSGHTESIVTEVPLLSIAIASMDAKKDPTAAESFLRRVDSDARMREFRGFRAISLAKS